MITVAADEFAKNFSHYSEVVQAESLAITGHDCVTGYFISKKEFDEFERLKARAVKAYAIQDLPMDVIEDISKSRMDSRHDALNALLGD